MNESRLATARRWLTTAEPAARLHYAGATVAVVVVSTAMLTVRDELGVLNVALVFLLVVFASALLAGSGPAVLAAILSFLAFDLLFIPPYHTFTVARSDHVLALFVYLGIAIVTGQLLARVRARTELAIREQRRTALLYELNAALIGDVTLDAILATIVQSVTRVYGAERCRILLPNEDGTLAIRAGPPSAQGGLAIDRQGLVMATWAMEHRSAAGLSTERRRIRLPHGEAVAPPPPLERRGRDLLYLPIATAQRTIGVIEVQGRPGGGRFNEDDEQVLMTFAHQAALALERARLSEEAAKAAALAQSDELKSALLAAVSHDLRTPLAAIKASATSMLDRSVAWDVDAQTEFLQAIDEETDRLTLMVGNLLDLSRIEGGVLKPDREWYDVAELIADVAARLTPRAEQHDHHVETRVEPGLPLAYFDYVEIAQVLMNLGENAIKYTPPGTTVTLAAKRAPDAIELAVHDTGPGIPAKVQRRLFEKFYRVDANNRVPGTGIGLSICKGLVEAHGGRIWVESGPGNGTIFRFTLPLSAAAEPAA